MVLLVVALLVLLVALPVAGWAVGAVLSAIVIGAIIGALARLVLPGRQDIGVLRTVGLGWLGSFVGGLIGRQVLHVGTVLTVLCEVAVAVVLVAVVSRAGRTPGNTLPRRSDTLQW